MFSNVHKTVLPARSLLHNKVAPGDFVDCYVTASDLPVRTAADLITEFPGWVKLLLLVRRVVTTPFGLSNDGPPASDRIGLFPVETESDHEVIAGFNDKHLDFRVSVISEAGKVYMATWVHTHNPGGRLYLASIMPFHILVARDALSRVSNQRVGTST